MDFRGIHFLETYRPDTILKSTIACVFYNIFYFFLMNGIGEIL